MPELEAAFDFGARRSRTTTASGIYSINGGARLVDSTLTGNGADFDSGYDLKTLKFPHLRNSTCGLSGRLLGDGFAAP